MQRLLGSFQVLSKRSHDSNPKSLEISPPPVKACKVRPIFALRKEPLLKTSLIVTNFYPVSISRRSVNICTVRPRFFPSPFIQLVANSSQYNPREEKNHKLYDPNHRWVTVHCKGCVSRQYRDHTDEHRFFPRKSVPEIQSRTQNALAHVTGSHRKLQLWSRPPLGPGPSKPVGSEVPTLLLPISL